jgi:hypothetical protein
MTPQLSTICADLGITVVHPAQHRPGAPMHTAAGQTLESILADRGADHLRDVLTAITESENNRAALTAPVIKAVSKIMAANPSWYADNAGRFLEIMDRADLGDMARRAKAAKGVVSAHDHIAALLLALLTTEFEPQGSLL